MNNKIVIAAGGTGGHFYPGLALARALRGKGKEVIFIVKKNDPARELLSDEHFDFIEVPASGCPENRLSLF